MQLFYFHDMLPCSLVNQAVEISSCKGHNSADCASGRLFSHLGFTPGQTLFWKNLELGLHFGRLLSPAVCTCSKYMFPLSSFLTATTVTPYETLCLVSIYLSILDNFIYPVFCIGIFIFLHCTFLCPFCLFLQHIALKAVPFHKYLSCIGEGRNTFD